VPESPSKTRGWPASIHAPVARPARVAAMPGMASGFEVYVGLEEEVSEIRT